MSDDMEYAFLDAHILRVDGLIELARGGDVEAQQDVDGAVEELANALRDLEARSSLDWYRPTPAVVMALARLTGDLETERYRILMDARDALIRGDAEAAAQLREKVSAIRAMIDEDGY